MTLYHFSPNILALASFVIFNNLSAVFVKKKHNLCMKAYVVGFCPLVVKRQDTLVLTLSCELSLHDSHLST